MTVSVTLSQGGCSSLYKGVSFITLYRGLNSLLLMCCWTAALLTCGWGLYQSAAALLTCGWGFRQNAAALLTCGCMRTLSKCNCTTDLWMRTLSKCSCFLSSSSSGRKPSAASLKITGSGFSRIQQTTASSNRPGPWRHFIKPVSRTHPCRQHPILFIHNRYT